MNIADPNGSIHAYRLDRERKEMWRTIAFSVLCTSVLLAGAALAIVAISIWRNQ